MREIHTILLVEDSDDDTFLLSRVFRRMSYRGDIQRCSDAMQAMDYLAGKGEYCDRRKYPVPQMLITDIKMPGSSGLDLLRWLREHPSLAVLPTVVLSSSGDPGEVAEAYSLGANSYMVKPASLDELQLMLTRLLDFWRICERPVTAIGSPCEASI